MQEREEIWVRPQGWEDPLEESMVNHSNILAWRIPRAEEPGRLQSIGLQRVGHNWSDLACVHRKPRSWQRWTGTRMDVQAGARRTWIGQGRADMVSLAWGRALLHGSWMKSGSWRFRLCCISLLTTWGTGVMPMEHQVRDSAFVQKSTFAL